MDRALTLLGVAAVLVTMYCGIPVFYIHVPMPSEDEMRGWLRSAD